MPTLKQIVEGTDTVAGRVFDWSIIFLIVVSIITFSFETLPDLSESVRSWLYYVEVVTVAIFSLEYLLRIHTAARKRDYVFSFYGIIDLLAIVPFYLGLAVDLRSIRIIRLLRLARILKMARYNAAIRRFHVALVLAREELVLFLGAAIILIYLSGVGVYYFENEAQPERYASVFHAIWWAVVTLTTVGYGDVFPVTLGGRIFTFFVLLIGIGVISIPAGLFASALGAARRLEEESAKDRAEDDGK